MHANNYYFVRLIFIAAIDYENIFTTKISRFTVSSYFQHQPDNDGREFAESISSVGLCQQDRKEVRNIEELHWRPKVVQLNVLGRGKLPQYGAADEPDSGGALFRLKHNTLQQSNDVWTNTVGREAGEWILYINYAAISLSLSLHAY